MQQKPDHHDQAEDDDRWHQQWPEGNQRRPAPTRDDGFHFHL
jgi:hypothetical protein